MCDDPKFMPVEQAKAIHAELHKRCDGLNFLLKLCYDKGYFDEVGAYNIKMSPERDAFFINIYVAKLEHELKLGAYYSLKTKFAKIVSEDFMTYELSTRYSILANAPDINELTLLQYFQEHKRVYDLNYLLNIKIPYES